MNNAKQIALIVCAIAICAGIIALAVLVLVIALWLTEPLHGWPTSIPALIGAFLIAAPAAGVTDTARLFRIDWGTVILAGTNLSLGTVLIVTGASAFLADLFFPVEGKTELVRNYWRQETPFQKRGEKDGKG